MILKISSTGDIDRIVQLFIYDLIDNIYITFDKTYLKIYFFKKIKSYKDIKLIRCDSSFIRLDSDLNDICDELLIFDEYGHCEDDVKNKVDKYKGIFIC